MKLRETILRQFLLKKIIFLFSLFAVLGHVQAQIVYVDAGSSCVSGCGDSWANAYSDLKEALNATNSGQIWVAKGTYRPADCPGTCQNIDRLEAFQLKNNVAIYGGFFGNETDIDQRNPTVNETVLSGNIGFDVNQNDNSFHVVVASNVDNTALLDGFIIRDGLANGNFGTNNGNGGAIYIEAISMGTCSPVIRNCVLTANEANAGGGAVFVNAEGGGTTNPLFEDCLFVSNKTEGQANGGVILHNVTEGGTLSPVYRNCTFESNNSNENGGALAFFASNFGTTSTPQILDCTFIDNRAADSGGAVYSSVTDNAAHQAAIQNSFFLRNEASGSGGAIFDGASFGAVSTTRILNCELKENSCAIGGGAVYLRGSHSASNFSILFNCIFDNNGTMGNGAAIYTTSAINGTNLGVCRPQIANCTFFENIAQGQGAALFNDYSNTQLSNSILWNGGGEIGNNNSNPTIRDCIVEGGYNDLGTFSNIYEDDPFFLLPEEGNFRLSYCSPAIDVGLLASIPIDSTDLDEDTSTSENIDIDADGIARTFGATVDLGAFEWSGSPGEEDVIFVKWDATGNNDGTSWENAYTDLQSALAATYPCANIWVATGEYKPVSCAGVCTVDEQGTSFNMKSQVAIYGGFRGNETLLEERDIALYETVLSGNIGEINTETDNTFHVVVAENVDSTGVLDGFTITSGNAFGGFGGNDIFGGGLFITANDRRANPSIRNCTFRSNQAKGGGGAVFQEATGSGILNSIFENCSFFDNNTNFGTSGGAIYHNGTAGTELSPVYRNCTFSNNSAQENGGAAAHFIEGDNAMSQLQFYDCIFQNNTASLRGGAIFASASNNANHQMIVQNCTFQDNISATFGGAIFEGATLSALNTSRIINTFFRNNRASTGGGAVFFNGSDSGTNRSIIFNSLFHENSTEQNGGAIYNSAVLDGLATGACESTIINCTFVGNAAINGRSIYNDQANPEINNSILWNGGDEITDNQAAPIVQNCVIQGGYQGNGFVSDIIDEDPLFLDAAEADFRLVSCSPAVDQGLTGLIPFDFSDVDNDNDSSEQIDIDLLESLRLFGGQVDLGAFEWNGFPAALTAEVVKDDVSCFGNCDGTVSVDPEGGTGNYLIAWSDGQEVFESSDLCPGDYKITITDGSLCTLVDSVEIIENDELEVLVTPDTTVCEGTEAPLSAIGQGGAGGYTYLWSENLGETSNVSFSPEEDQQIIVIVTDDNGCVKIDSIDVALAENPIPEIDGPSSLCQGDSIVLQTNGFEQYEWSSGQETSAINVNEGGTYEVTVTDTNGCVGVTSVEVAQLVTPEPVIQGDTSFCSGGAVQLEVGVFETYEWSTGSEQSMITVMEANTFSVVVTNEDGCEGFAMVNVVENISPEVEITGDPSFCEGDSTTLESGVFVAYDWSTGDTTATISATQEGTYSLTVTDENGCEGEDTFAISTNENPSVEISGDAQFCAGDSTLLDAGLFESYEWSTGAMTSSIQVSNADAYSVTVADVNGCMGTASVMVTENPMPIVEIEGGPGFCPGDSTLLEVGPFSDYLWSTGAMTPIIHVMAADQYSITVTDENGCTAAAQIEIDAFAEPMVEIGGELAFCEGDSTVLDAGDFTAYVWTGGANTPILTVLEGGNFGVTVTDDNGCQAVGTATVVENANPMVEIAGEPSYCSGDSTQLDAGLYESYLWSTTEETQTIDATQPGIYEVAVVDENGCVGSAAIEISEFELPEPQIDGLLSFCDGGSTTLSTGDFESYEWSNGGTTSEISVMQTGTFSVTVEDVNGCLGTNSVEVMEAEDIQFEILGELTFCDGDSTQLNAGDFDTYEWSTGEMTATINPTNSGTFAVTVTNAAGCTGESSVIVQENDPVDVSISGASSFCEGTSTSLSVDAGFDTYIWSNTATGNSIEVEEGGLYMVTVTDVDGCSGMASLEVSEAPAPMPVISGELNICEGEMTTLEVGTFDTYLWSDGSTAATLEINTGGLFSVTVTDQTGCTGETEAMVAAIGQPQAEILGASNGVCLGESVELMASGEGEYTWIDPDGTLTVISPELAIAGPANTATYGLAVANACFSDTTFLELQVFDQPLIDAGPDVIVKEGEEVRLEASGASAYEWSGDNSLSCTSCAGPIVTPDSTATFIAIGTDANGCQGMDSVTVTVLTEDVKLVDPVNAFTPNNDGVNDFFVIKEIEQFDDHKLTIFNRWGDTVFESLSYENDWDGTYNGELLPAGTYLYVLVIAAAGEKQVIKSTITIVRE